MSKSERAKSVFPIHGAAAWFQRGGPLAPRIRGVFRLDAETLAEISADPSATAQAFGVVAFTAVLVGVGRLTPMLAFLSIAVAIVAWGVSTGLIWSVGVLTQERRPDFARLLRVSGFAYAWNALQLGASLPFIGGALGWASFAGWMIALVLGVRHVMGTSTLRSVAVVAGGLALPLLFAWLA